MPCSEEEARNDEGAALAVGSGKACQAVAAEECFFADGGGDTEDAIPEC